jgi:hypothetical protein
VAVKIGHGADPPMVACIYAADRKSERVEAHLGDFAGILQVEGYGGYAALARRQQKIRASCGKACLREGGGGNRFSAKKDATTNSYSVLRDSFSAHALAVK